MSAVISVRDLTVAYDDTEVLTDITFAVERGRLIGVIGPNGAGKSTLFKAMLGLIPTRGGEVRFFGQPVHNHRPEVAYVAQRSGVDWDFPINVLDTVVTGTYPRCRLFRRPGQEERDWARTCLRRVGLEDYAHRQISQLSGGQQQRMFIARALAQRAQLFLLDEPFVGVDADSEAKIVDVLRELRAEGKTAIIVHHDLSTVEQYYDDVLILNQRLIASGPVADVFVPEVITEAFASREPLLRAIGVTT